MRLPYSPFPFLVFLALLGLLALGVQLGALTVAFDKLGLSAGSAFVLLFASLLGSAVNVPLFFLRAQAPGALPASAASWYRLLRHPPRAFHGRTLVAVNVGGCVIPVMFSLYLLSRSALGPGDVALGIGSVALLSYFVSRPIAGLGIAMPILLAPVAAALTALAFNPEHSAPLAYVSGTLGVLIGADLLRMPDIRRLGAPLASIGGAGTFDGIFMTGILAVLLA
jgi:uncharacterized membrane protein